VLADQRGNDALVAAKNLNTITSMRAARSGYSATDIKKTNELTGTNFTAGLGWCPATHRPGQHLITWKIINESVRIIAGKSIRIRG